MSLPQLIAELKQNIAKLEELIRKINDLNENRIGDVSTADTLNYLIKDLNENRIGDVDTEDTLNYLVNGLNDKIGGTDVKNTLMYFLKRITDTIVKRLHFDVNWVYDYDITEKWTVTDIVAINSDYFMVGNGDTYWVVDKSFNVVSVQQVPDPIGDVAMDICGVSDGTSIYFVVDYKNEGTYLIKVDDWTQTPWTASEYHPTVSASDLTWHDGTIYASSGNNIYSIDPSDGSYSTLFTLPSEEYGTGIADSGKYLLIFDGHTTDGTKIRKCYFYTYSGVKLAEFSLTEQPDSAEIVLGDEIVYASSESPWIRRFIIGGVLSVDVQGFDVDLSTRASESTLQSILNQLDVALSTRASESTLSGVKTQTDKLTFDGSNYLYVNVGGDTVGLALDSTLSSFSGRFEPVSATDSVAAGDNTAGLSVQVTADGRPNMELYYNVGGAATINVYGSNDGSTWRKTDVITTSGADEDTLFYYNAYRYVKVECPTTSIDVTLEVTCSR